MATKEMDIFNKNITQTAGPSNLPSKSNDSQPLLFNLDTDCCDEIFQYLSMESLCSLGQTCKAMYLVVSDFFKRNYVGFHIDYLSTNPDWLKPTFHQFFTCFSIGSCIPHYIKDYTLQHLLHSLDDLTLEFFDFRGNFCFSLKSIRSLLSQIRSLKLNECDLVDSYHELLKYCVRLKSLSLSRPQDIDTDFWHRCKFPNLERLHIYKCNLLDGIGVFLERHTSIRTFSTNWEFIKDKHNELLASKAMIDMLIISDKSEVKQTNLELLCKIVDKLYTLGFYKRLHLTIHFQFFECFATLRGLEHLTVIETFLIHSENVNGLMYNMRELNIRTPLNDKEIEILASMPNLERATLHLQENCEIWPFVRRSRKLNELKVRCLSYAWSAVDLRPLNEERGKIPGARKITIYLEESDLLDIKWSTHLGEIDLSLIKLKRLNVEEFDRKFFP